LAALVAQATEEQVDWVHRGGRPQLPPDLSADEVVHRRAGRVLVGARRGQLREVGAGGAVSTVGESLEQDGAGCHVPPRSRLVRPHCRARGPGGKITGRPPPFILQGGGRVITIHQDSYTRHTCPRVRIWRPMPFTAECPYCSRKVRAPDNAAG